MEAKHTPESVADAILKAAGTRLSNYMPSSKEAILAASNPYADAMNESAAMLLELKNALMVLQSVAAADPTWHEAAYARDKIVRIVAIAEGRS